MKTQPAGNQEDVWEFSGLLTAVADPPRAELDPFLDAAATCFARYGIRRTSVQDVAREMGVDRTTVYRQVGTIPQQVRLLATRDLSRLLNSLPVRAQRPFGPASVIETMVSVINDMRHHPVVAKTLADDAQTITLSGLAVLPPLLSQAAETIGPMLEAAMDAGVLARRDPLILAEWLVRLVVTLVLVPSQAELRSSLFELLLPVLTP
jgi:AcrR family transcriptional regulator